jgi:hypothetical protein
MADEEDTKYYEYEGNAAYMRGGDLMRVQPDGHESRIGEIAKFMYEASPITRAEFDRMTGRSDGGSSKAGRDRAVAEVLADPQKWRAETEAELRADNPHMTPEQIEANLDLVAKQFGL